MDTTLTRRQLWLAANEVAGDLRNVQIVGRLADYANTDAQRFAAATLARWAQYGDWWLTDIEHNMMLSLAGAALPDFADEEEYEEYEYALRTMFQAAAAPYWAAVDAIEQTAEFHYDYADDAGWLATEVVAAAEMLEALWGMSRSDLTLEAFGADSLRTYFASRLLHGHKKIDDNMKGQTQ